MPEVLQGMHWVLDPIDGTRGFVGLRQYAVCLGLLDQGQVQPCPICCFTTPALLLSLSQIEYAVSCSAQVWHWQTAKSPSA